MNTQDNISNAHYIWHNSLRIPQVKCGVTMAEHNHSVGHFCAVNYKVKSKLQDIEVFRFNGYIGKAKRESAFIQQKIMLRRKSQQTGIIWKMKIGKRKKVDCPFGNTQVVDLFCMRSQFKPHCFPGANSENKKKRKWGAA